MPETVLEEASRLINGDRAKEYGPPRKNFADIAYGWKAIFGVDITPEQVACAMIWLKIMRFQNGKSRDSVVDMAGYAGTIGKVMGWDD